MKMNWEMNYQEREKAKSEAWAVLVNPDKTTKEKAWNAINKLIRSHYYRACEALEGEKSSFKKEVHGHRYSRGYELEIDVYIEHWLWANGDSLLEPCVLKEIADEHGYRPVQHKLLRKGNTSYTRSNT